MPDDPIGKINRINPSRNPYNVDKDFDELVYKRKMRSAKPKAERTFKKTLDKKIKVEKKKEEKKIKDKKWHAKYKNGKRIY